MTPAIFGLEGLAVSSSERDFFRDSAPMGYILFGRNVESRDQLRRLTDDLRELHGNSALPILIDQELDGKLLLLDGGYFFKPRRLERCGCIRRGGPLPLQILPMPRRRGL